MDNWWYLTAKWNSSIDERKRLNFPRKLLEEIFGHEEAAGKIMYFGVSRNGGQIVISAEKRRGMPYNERISKNNTNYRILIPPQLRETNSFFFGRNVILVFFNKNNVVEIWPRR